MSFSLIVALFQSSNLHFGFFLFFFLTLLSVNGWSNFRVYDRVYTCSTVSFRFWGPCVRTGVTNTLPVCLVVLSLCITFKQGEKVKLAFKFIFRSLNDRFCYTMMCLENMRIFSCIFLVSSTMPNLALCK